MSASPEGLIHGCAFARQPAWSSGPCPWWAGCKADAVATGLSLCPQPTLPGSWAPDGPRAALNAQTVHRQPCSLPSPSSWALRNEESFLGHGAAVGRGEVRCPSAPGPGGGAGCSWATILSPCTHGRRVSQGGPWGRPFSHSSSGPRQWPDRLPVSRACPPPTSASSAASPARRARPLGLLAWTTVG